MRPNVSLHAKAPIWLDNKINNSIAQEVSICSEAMAQILNKDLEDIDEQDLTALLTDDVIAKIDNRLQHMEVLRVITTACRDTGHRTLRIKLRTANCMDYHMLISLYSWRMIQPIPRIPKQYTSILIRISLLNCPIKTQIWNCMMVKNHMIHTCSSSADGNGCKKHPSDKYKKRFDENIVSQKKAKEKNYICFL